MSILQLLKNLKQHILLQTTVNMCETGHNNMTFTVVEKKNLMRIPWGTPEIQWFCLKQLKTAYFKHFEHFPAIEIFEKKICCQPLRICVKLVTTTWLSPLLRKNLHGNTLRHTWDTVILLKSAYFKHFEHFAAN